MKRFCTENKFVSNSDFKRYTTTSSFAATFTRAIKNFTNLNKYNIEKMIKLVSKFYKLVFHPTQISAELRSPHFHCIGQANG